MCLLIVRFCSSCVKASNFILWSLLARLTLKKVTHNVVVQVNIFERVDENANEVNQVLYCCANKSLSCSHLWSKTKRNYHLFFVKIVSKSHVQLAVLYHHVYATQQQKFVVVWKRRTMLWSDNLGLVACHNATGLHQEAIIYLFLHVGVVHWKF